VESSRTQPVPADAPKANYGSDHPAVTGPDSSRPETASRLVSESGQTGADNDQTLSDTDQTGADGDQTSADIDQVASDRDQAASDRDLAAGADPRQHDITRSIREHTTAQREQTARSRLDTASQRDAIAHARDLEAVARDQAAAVRDLVMAQRDAAADQPGNLADSAIEILVRAREQRKSGAEFRVRAAEHRELAAEDRLAAAEDREQAANERLRALADREHFLAEPAMAETDQLTGTLTLAAGLADLDRELDRCRRTGSDLVVAYVDVVGLKEVNDTLGHPAGDELLRDVANLFSEQLRSYDLIVRVGGDEFLCAIEGMSEAEVRARFSVIGSALAGRPSGRGIRTVFATLRDYDTARDLIARADAELVRQPHPPRFALTLVADPGHIDESGEDDPHS
jgi:GGDEF domain-containing protein